MLQDRKLGDQGCLNAVTTGPFVNIKDCISNQHFLRDMGASYNVFYSPVLSRPHRPRALGSFEDWAAASSSAGGMRATHQTACSDFTLIFLLVDAHVLILSMYFLKHHLLPVGPGAGCLVDSRSLKVFPHSAWIAGVVAKLLPWQRPTRPNRKYCLISRTY